MAKRILAVDDEKNIRRLVEVNLVRAGYQVETACDGREALERVAAQRPDMVVLDVMMPYLDGFEVLRHLKADPGTAEIPVIMLTAKAQDADIMRGWTGGCDTYLTKPFNPAELLTFVKRIFDNPMDGGEQRIRI
jgi:two-component system, OmpR family, alkaline phosphatase synthesis response regulator PhoP